MKPDKRNALYLAFERDIVSKDRATVFCNACPLPGLNPGELSHFQCIQGFRPVYNALIEAGHTTAPMLENAKSFDQALLLLGRNRKQNEAWIAKLWNRLPDGGRLIVAGDKTDGVGSVRKWFAGQADVSDSFSKYHAVIFWVDKQIGQTIAEPSLDKTVDGFHLAEGMFSASGPDRGSMLLAEHFDNRIRGRVADLGAGWGYLSARLLYSSIHVKQLDLFEADHASLAAAKNNVVSNGECQVSFNWIDVTSEFEKRPYDWVVMNPPFHAGRASEPALGQRFIEVAASTLPNGGRLMLVANVNLPYERILGERFRSFETVVQRDGFKVLMAVK